MPESWRICGEPIAPAARIVSTRASANTSSPPRRSSTPVARFPSSRIRLTCTSVMTVMFGRLIAGLRKPFAALQRTPRRWFTSKNAAPSLSPPLKSSTFGMPACAIASRKASSTSHESRCRSTRHSPPAACISLAPPWWSSERLNTGNTLDHDHAASPAIRAHSS
jgi:hypothetical protein